jgi:hypothetical protein
MLKNSPGLSSYRGYGTPSFGSIPSGTFYRGQRPSDYSARMLKERGDPLAEFSGINPKKIIGSQKGSKESALNFISGGSPIGSSVLSGAKNNIVGFDRAKISPKKNNLGSLISTLTTNIFNNTNSVSNIFGDKKEKSEKGFKPFGGFFDKVKEAIGFISFFGSKKNLDKIKENIENLKTTFTETFDVAKALRKAILKIIEQLSGFSGGGGGGGIIGAIMSALGGLVGGLIPGMRGKRPPNVAGPTMKQEGNLLSKMPKGLQGGGGIGKLLLGGAAALGTGAAVSGLSQPGGEEVQPGDTAPEVPGNLLDKFNSILDRFDKALDGLRGGKGKKGSDSSAKSSGSSGGGGSPTPTPLSPSGAPTGVTIKDDAQALKELGLTQEQYNALKQGVADVEGARYNQMGGAGTRFAGRYQMGSNEIEDSAKVMGIPVPSQQEYLNNPELQEKIYMGRTVYMHRRLQSLSPKYNTMSPRERAVALGMGQLGEGNVSSYINTGTLPRDSAGAPITKWGTAVGKRFDGASSIPSKPQPGQQAPPPAPVLPSAEQLRKPPAAKASGAETPQVSLVNVGSGTPQASPSRPSSTTTPPSPTGGNGPTAPFLPSYNPDNFLTLYSRMVYNIVG